MILKKINFILIASLLLFSCEKDYKLLGPPRQADLIMMGEGVTDVEGNHYPTIIIGGQEWMAENLKTTTYCNGDTIKGVRDSIDMMNKEIDEALWFIYDYSNEEIYGKLYTWYAAVSEKGICPCGWEMPTKKDWRILVNSISNYYGITKHGVGKKMKAGALENGTGYWTTENVYNVDITPEMIGDNETNFSVLPGGLMDDTQFFLKNTNAYFWTSSEVDSISFKADFVILTNISGDVGISSNYGQPKYNGMSIRCVKKF